MNSIKSNFIKHNLLRLKKGIYLLLFVPLFLNSCGLFLSPFSPQSYKYFTQLKVLHLKFIETFTQGEDKVFDKEKIDDFYNQIDIVFREAIEYEKQVTDDKTRLNAFEILYDEFKSNYKFLIDTSKLYSQTYSEELQSEVDENYNLAIKGELSRRNAPQG